MKRSIAALSILCGGLLIATPSFAQNLNTNNTNNIKIEQERQTTEEQDNVNVVPVKENKIEDVKKEEVNVTPVVKEEKTEAPKEDIINQDTTEKQVIKEEVKEENKSTVEVVKQLNQDQAKELLAMYNPNAEYSYQGDENTFAILKDKGLSGYVFLANIESDLGYFVDKNTTDIYYFHPSGYLEKIR